MSVTIQRVPRAPSGSGQCMAGAAEVDLTPEPGLDLSGYSAMAKSSRGTLGRLMAHALYLEDASGEQLALVWLDLMVSAEPTSSVGTVGDARGALHARGTRYREAVPFNGGLDSR